MNEKFITLDDKKIIVDNYLRVRDTIKAASKEAGRNPIDIRLIVVSKTQSVRAIEPLLELGRGLRTRVHARHYVAGYPLL